MAPKKFFKKRRRLETEDGRQETGDKRGDTGDRRQETGDKRQETGDERGFSALIEKNRRNLIYQ